MFAIAPISVRRPLRMTRMVDSLVRGGSYSLQLLEAAYADPEATCLSDRPGCQNLTWFMRGDLAVLVATDSGTAISIRRIFSVDSPRVLTCTGTTVPALLHSALIARRIPLETVAQTLRDPESTAADLQGRTWYLRAGMCLHPDETATQVLDFSVERKHAVALPAPVQFGPAWVLGYSPAVLHPGVLDEHTLIEKLGRCDVAEVDGHRVHLGISQAPGYEILVDPWGTVIWAGKERGRRA